MILIFTRKNIRTKSDGSKLTDLKTIGKSISESGVRKFEMRKKNENNSLQAGHSKSLLSVPSIYVDTMDSESNISALFDTTSISEDPPVFDLPSLKDAETVSMIVRNVEAFEQMEQSRNLDTDEKMVEIALTNKVESLSEQKVGSPKKHDFIGSIQEKLHHFSDNIKKHEIMHSAHSSPREHGKTKEMLHELKENVSGKIHQIAEKMHNFHLPHHQEAAKDGLVAQAMQTILMEKFNIAEATTGPHPSLETNQKRKSSSSSLNSIKQKFNLFQRPRRSVELQSETTSLKSISEVNSPASSELSSEGELQFEDHKMIHHDEISLLECKLHELTVRSNDQKSISKDDLRLGVDNLVDSLLSTHKTFSSADTNKKPLHESLLSLSRNDVLSTSPAIKTHNRTESIGFSSPSRNVSNSLGKDQMTTGIHR